MAKNVRLTDTVEDSVKTFAEMEAADTPKPLNEAAAKFSTISRHVDDDFVTLNFAMPKGGEFTVGDRQASRLIAAGVAVEITE